MVYNGATLMYSSSSTCVTLDDVNLHLNYGFATTAMIKGINFIGR